MTEVDAEREAIARFLHALDKNKKPHPADCLAAARFILAQRGFGNSLAILGDGPIFGRDPVKRGRPVNNWPALRNAVALRRVVLDRDPTTAELEQVAADRGISVRTLKRHWKAQRANAVWPFSVQGWLEEYAPEIERLREEVGEQITETKLLRMAIVYRQTPANERAALCQELRKQSRIVGTKSKKDS